MFRFAQHAAATPNLSFNSRIIRSAVFFPRPLIFEIAATSEFTTAALKLVTLIPLKTASASFGPIPETLFTSNRKRSRSAGVMAGGYSSDKYMTGDGIFAEQISSLFKVGCRRAGIGARPTLSCKSFRRSTTQLRLFG